MIPTSSYIRPRRIALPYVLTLERCRRGSDPLLSSRKSSRSPSINMSLHLLQVSALSDLISCKNRSTFCRNTQEYVNDKYINTDNDRREH